MGVTVRYDGTDYNLHDDHGTPGEVISAIDDRLTRARRRRDEPDLRLTNEDFDDGLGADWRALYDPWLPLRLADGTAVTLHLHDHAHIAVFAAQIDEVAVT